MQSWLYFAIGGASVVLCLIAVICGACHLAQDKSANADEEQQALLRKPRARRESRTAAMIPKTPTEFNTKINALSSLHMSVESVSADEVRSQNRDFFGVSPSEVNEPSEFFSRSMLERLAAERLAADLAQGNDDGALTIPISQDEWRTEAVVTLAPSSLNSTCCGSYDDTPAMPENGAFEGMSPQSSRSVTPPLPMIAVAGLLRPGDPDGAQDSPA